MKKLFLAACCAAALTACQSGKHIAEESIQTVNIADASAHWLQPQQLVWNTTVEQGNQFRLVSLPEGNASQMTAEQILNGTYVALTPMANANTEGMPHLADFAAFSLPVPQQQAKQWAGHQLLAVKLDSNNQLLAASQVQQPRLLDYLYTRLDNDADEQPMGAVFDGNKVMLNLWAPTAREVKVVVFNDAFEQQQHLPMTLDQDTGIWSLTGNRKALDRRFYRYELKVFHPATGKVETLQVTDPYSVSLSANGRHSQIVDLNDADLKPQGWDNHKVPVVDAPEDAVIYETHIRDFSILDASTPKDYRGKYMAFTVDDSAPVQHLQRLQQAGLNYLHVLPANDIATVNEVRSERVELTDTVADLCAVKPGAKVCNEADASASLLSLMLSYTPESDDAQALADALRPLDGFNWGYDPHHFAAPEGSYATDPDGVARIIEMRAMNQSLHEMGLRTVLDVVYNHTSEAGLGTNSVLDKVVPGYYHRLNEVTGAIERSTCCENTATEHRMMAKLMNDSLVSFAEHFGYDAFRFDLMGHIPKQAILDAREAVRAVDPDTYFYGEGWNFGEVVDNRRIEQASQLNMAGSEIGTFSDRQREGVRSAALFLPNGSLDEQDTIRVGLAGNVGSYQFTNAQGQTLSMFEQQWRDQPAGYSVDPADTINYVSKHDNETLWDVLQYQLPSEMPLADRTRIHVQALSIPLLSQGIPFLHMGSDLIRSKSMDRNSYDAGDWFNRVDFTQASVNWNIGLPFAAENQGKWQQIKQLSSNPNAAITPTEVQFSAAMFEEFLSIRNSSKLFRLTSPEEVQRSLVFHNTGPQQRQGLIVMELRDGEGSQDLDPRYSSIMVVINGGGEAVSFSVAQAKDYRLHPVQQRSDDPVVRRARFTPGTFHVPARTTAVFVKTR